MLTSRQMNRDAISHALFDVSTYTRAGRNQPAVSLVAKARAKAGLETRLVSLLGSGPLEPFETAANRSLRDARVYAFDINRDVVELAAQAVDGGTIPLADVARICRSSCTENHQLDDPHAVRDDLERAGVDTRLLGMDLKADIAHLVPADGVRRRVQVAQKDLSQGLPHQVGTCDLILEGYMLVNWAKRTTTRRHIRPFMQRVATALSDSAWFVSCSSGSFYEDGVFGGPGFLDEAVDSGLHPVAGTILRMAIGDGEAVTSQFCSVFSRCDSWSLNSGSFRPVFREIPEEIVRQTRGAITCVTERRDLAGLREGVRRLEVLSYSRVSPGVYDVCLADWTTLAEYARANHLRVVSTVGR